MKQFIFLLILLSCWIGIPTVSHSAASDSLDLVRDGASRFVICLPNNPSNGVRNAAEILRDYLRRISGADLSIVQGTPSQSNCIIFEIADSSSKMFGDDGFRLQSDNHRLTLTARTSLGLRNAVYTFLETYMGCRKYSPTVEVVPRQSTVTLPIFDDTQIPALTFRLQDFRDSSYAAWHKLSSRDDWGLFVHTFETLLPSKVYFKDHPEYFSENNGVRTPDGQLCLSNSEVFRIVVAELRRLMKEQPDAHYWSVSQNDTYLPCCCAICSAIDKEEGSQSGSLIRFVNKVAAEFPDKTISTLAYQYSRSAPKLTKPAPNVNIMLCSIECDRSKPINANPQDSSFVHDVREWSRLTHNIFLWDYVIQFSNLVSPFPNLRVLQPNMKFFVENGITSVFEQGISEMHGEFAELRTYLISKLLWNPYVNIDSVMNDFLQGYYGDAAPFILQYIDTMHDALEKSGEGLSCFGYPFPLTNGYLSAPMMEQYQRFFPSAENAVTHKADLHQRAQTAHIPLLFAQLEQAKLLGDADGGCFKREVSGRLSIRAKYENLLNSFEVRCEQAGITKLREHGNSPTEYLESTRHFLMGSTIPNWAVMRPVTLAVPASDKYHQGQASALTDGMVGWDDYHCHWLGFEGTDMEATVDLGEVIKVTGIETAFLQDINSWIFMPKSVEYFVSSDGKRFQSVGELLTTTDPHQGGAVREPYALKLKPQSARYVRVKAEGLKQCPSWHKGFGGKSWVFCDEIKVF